MKVIRQRGYHVNSLVAPVEPAHVAMKNVSTTLLDWQLSQPHEPAHGTWSGSIWESDAQEAAAMLANLQPDWLVVDHYV